MIAWRPSQALETFVFSARAASSRCSLRERLTERRCFGSIPRRCYCVPLCCIMQHHLLCREPLHMSKRTPNRGFTGDAKRDISFPTKPPEHRGFARKPPVKTSRRCLRPRPRSRPSTQTSRNPRGRTPCPSRLTGAVDHGRTSETVTAAPPPTRLCHRRRPRSRRECHPGPHRPGWGTTRESISRHWIRGCSAPGRCAARPP